MQPDTIIPDLSNPQSWNRYSYVRNDPIIYSDPTGHAEETDNDGACQNLRICRREFLDRRAREIVKALGGKDDLEGMAQIIDVGAKLFPDYDDLIPILSDIFLGVEESNSLTVKHAHDVPEEAVCSIIGRFCKDDPEKGFFQDEGFNKKYQDTDNQPYHFWAYLSTSANTEGWTYLTGLVVGTGANIYHETDGSPSATWQDFALGQEGISIGLLINWGVLPSDQLGNYLRTHLGD